MDIEKVVEAISQERLQPYRIEDGTNADALERYKTNIVLSEAFYPSLHMLEITLRNTLEVILIRQFGGAWHQNTRLTNLMVERGRMKPEGKQLKKAKTSLRDQHKQFTSGRVVAELNFGFWTALLGKAYEDIIWRPYGTDIFPHIQAAERDIRKIRADLKMIRLLRNRIAHHEPIWNDPDLYAKYQAIRRFVRWLNADAETWLDRCDRYDDVYQRVYTPRATN